VKHLRRDLEDLKREILIMGALVEEALSKAITAQLDRRLDLAHEVMDADREMDEKEVAIEEACLKILALHQPVATDLRFIIAVMKVNNDLERMGDLAVNIAERAAYLAQHEPVTFALPLADMARKVSAMTSECLDALVNLDTGLARKVWGDDDIVDNMNREVFRIVEDAMRRDPEVIVRALHNLSVSRHLERIADAATNIAEDVIFMVDGEIVRHRVEDYLSNSRQET
jgi:phosphate transport system protein